MDEIIQPMHQQYGPYTTVKRIGPGGQSAVFSAKHEESGRLVALRVMTMMVKDIDTAVAECNAHLAEVEELSVPNTVQIEDYGTAGGTLYIAMNVMKGGTLLERMVKRSIGPELPGEPQLPAAQEVLAMIERVAETLDDLHSLDMVHGQLEPRSIMFNEAGETYLADIGLTRLMKIIYRMEATNSLNVTKYTPPELWDGIRPVNSSDQYSLACIVYELLTGQAAFEGGSIFGLMQAHTDQIVSPPHYVREELPGDLAMVFWQALAKPVDRRYSSVMAFYDALASALADFEEEPTDFFTFALE